MSEKILVLGASTSVGTELVNRLAHIGTPVRAAIYDPQKLQNSFHYPTVEPVAFNFESQHSIETAMQGIEFVFVIGACSEQLPFYLTNTLMAARSLSVKHIGFLSVIGADDPHAPKMAQWFKEAEYLIKNSTVPYTILRSNCLMQNILEYLQPDTNLICLPASEGKVSIIDARDVASVAADLFLPGTHHLWKTYNLTGSKPYSMFQIADILSSVTGQPITYVNSSKETSGYSLNGKFEEWQMDIMLEYVRYLFSGKGETVYGTVEQVAGIEPISFIDFARDYAQQVRSIIHHA